MKKFHRDCCFCGEDGLILSDFQVTDTGLQAELVVDARHEGWPGIPHGGIAMTSMIELADLLGDLTGYYPIRADFRFGGDRILLGDEIVISVVKEYEGYRGEINKRSGKQPYLKSLIDHRVMGEYEDRLLSIKKMLEAPVKSSNSFTVPDFVNRIIFKKAFQPVHQYRIFEFRELSDRRICMLCFFRNAEGVIQHGEFNLISETQVHPGAIITVLDETLGWSGFFTVWQGGVTVNLMTYFIRPVEPDETIFSVGICDDVYGSHRRKIVCCSGGIFSMKNDTIDPVAYSMGKWLTNPEFKERMLKHLEQKKQVGKAFTEM
jgi:acyl-coenzyme A thioesterase PaaI-like protein